ncbi:MAG: MerC domain-containing protein [Pseudomonadota bacterium]
MPLSFSAAPKRGFFDGMAIGLSGLCLIHCLALPLMLVALPNLSIARHWPEELHLIAAVLAAFACCAAIVPRWPALKKRQKVSIGVFAIMGLLCLFGAMTISDHLGETLVTVVGSAFLIVAHIQNLRA